MCLGTFAKWERQGRTTATPQSILRDGSSVTSRLGAATVGLTGCVEGQATAPSERAAGASPADPTPSMIALQKITTAVFQIILH
jgi:hypothetical protein